MTARLRSNCSFRFLAERHLTRPGERRGESAARAPVPSCSWCGQPPSIWCSPLPACRRSQESFQIPCSVHWARICDSARLRRRTTMEWLDCQ